MHWLKVSPLRLAPPKHDGGSPKVNTRRALARKFLLPAAVSAGALLAGCSTPTAGDTAQGDAVKLGAVVPASGPLSEWGASNEVAVELCEENVNADGGVNGKDLEIITYDTGTDPVEAANLVRRLATEDEVIAVIGPLSSSEAEVAFPVANQLSIPVTAYASSKPGVAEQNRPWAFRNTLDEGVMLNGVLPVLTEQMGTATAAIAYDSADAVGTSLGTALLPTISEEHGVEVPNADDPVSFGTTDVDLRSQASTLIDLAPDAVGIGSWAPGAAKLIREVSRQGQHIPVYGGSTLIDNSILDADPETPIITAGTYFPGAEEAAEWTEQMTQALEEAGIDVPPTMFDMQTYEICMMYTEAIREGNLQDEDLETARTGVQEFMASLEGFPGITNEITMQETGDITRGFYVIQGADGEWNQLAAVEP